jgi:hypothetical protein
VPPPRAVDARFAVAPDDARFAKVNEAAGAAAAAVAGGDDDAEGDGGGSADGGSVVDGDVAGEEDVEGGGGGDSGSAGGGGGGGATELLPGRMRAFVAEQAARGLVYVARPPPFMRAAKLRHIMSAYGAIGRVCVRRRPSCGGWCKGVSCTVSRTGTVFGGCACVGCGGVACGLIACTFIAANVVCVCVGGGGGRRVGVCFAATVGMPRCAAVC